MSWPSFMTIASDLITRPSMVTNPITGDDVIPAFEKEYLYQSWGSMVYTSQDLLWETVGDTVDRLRPAFEARAQGDSQIG